MIVALVGKPDWFRVPNEWLPEVGKLPIVQFDRENRLMVHRTHLPALAMTHSEVAELLNGRSLTAAARLSFDEMTNSQGWALRPYQHVGREYLRARRGALLADQMRLGKTVQILAAHEPRDGQLLIVAPLATRDVWLKWCARRWPGVEPLVIKTRKYDPEQLPGREVVFAHYDVVASWMNYGRFKIGTLVFDEAHLLSNRRANRTIAALALASRAARVVCATGTPLWNKPSGLWPILGCLAPGAFGKWYDFSLAYCNGHPGAYGFVADGVSRVEELRERLGQLMLRRTWADVRTDLPPIERSIEIADVPAKKTREIEMASEAIRKADSRRTLVGRLANYRRLVGAVKVAPTVELAERYLAAGESVVIWAWHRDVATMIMNQLIDLRRGAFLVTGDTPDVQRGGTFAAWAQTSPAALVITMSVGQVGIDLSAARHCIFAELDWTPANVAQAEMRTFSPDQPMTATYVVVDHETDRALVQALWQKCSLADAIGTPAADTAIDTIFTAFGMQDQTADLDRLRADIMASRADLDDAGPPADDDDDNYFTLDDFGTEGA